MIVQISQNLASTLNPGFGFQTDAVSKDYERVRSVMLLTKSNDPNKDRNRGMLAAHFKRSDISVPRFKAGFETPPVNLRYRVTYADALLASGQATTAPSTVDEFIQSRLNGAVEFALW